MNISCAHAGNGERIRSDRGFPGRTLEGDDLDDFLRAYEDFILGCDPDFDDVPPPVGSDDLHSTVVRTVIRRYRDGELQLDRSRQANPFVAALKSCLREKIEDRTRQGVREFPLLVDPADPAPPPHEAQAHRDAWNEFRDRQKSTLESMKKRMAPYLVRPYQRQVFRCLLDNECGSWKLTHRMIAERCQCSESSVARVKSAYDRLWSPLVREMRDELRDWRSRHGI
jgi:hypothetical protein